jgi:hypothetical protein
MGVADLGLAALNNFQCKNLKSEIVERFVEIRFRASSVPQ